MGSGVWADATFLLPHASAKGNNCDRETQNWARHWRRAMPSDLVVVDPIIHQFSKLAVAAHKLLHATCKILLATEKLRRTTARFLSVAAPRGAQMIRYTATAERSCGWCSSAPGAHPQYHANSLQWQCARGFTLHSFLWNSSPSTTPVLPRWGGLGNGADQQSDEQNGRTF